MKADKQPARHCVECALEVCVYLNLLLHDNSEQFIDLTVSHGRITALCTVILSPGACVCVIPQWESLTLMSLTGGHNKVTVKCVKGCRHMHRLTHKMALIWSYIQLSWLGQLNQTHTHAINVMRLPVIAPHRPCTHIHDHHHSGD